MNPTELLKIAPNLSKSRKARVHIPSTNETAVIIPPGTDGKKLTLQLESSSSSKHPPKTFKKDAKDVILIEIPKPKKAPPLALPVKCDNCDNAAQDLKCGGCGVAICSKQCSEDNWKTHKPKCHKRRARALGEEHAREENRGLRLCEAALCFVGVSMMCLGCGMCVVGSASEGTMWGRWYR